VFPVIRKSLDSMTYTSAMRSAVRTCKAMEVVLSEETNHPVEGEIEKHACNAVMWKITDLRAA